MEPRLCVFVIFSKKADAGQIEFLDLLSKYGHFGIISMAYIIEEFL